jgi:hypothetical protein
MANLQLTLSDEEQSFLAHFLEKSLQDLRIEEHRTRAPDYRQLIIDKEEVASSLLKKLSAHA